MRTIDTTIKNLENNNFIAKIISPDDFVSFSYPLYKEIKFSIPNSGKIKKLIEEFKPDYIHIPTEGMIGLQVRNYCIKNNIPFTTFYHTNFPDFLYKTLKIPTFITYKYLRWFHKNASLVLCTTNSMKNILENNGFKNLRIWSRGVDRSIFYSHTKTNKYQKSNDFLPVYVYVGRVSKEKGIEDFLSLELDCIKVIVGDGPELGYFKKKYKDVIFTGPKSGEDLVKEYCEADIFVFPSKFDTFGLVLIEALSCGIPIASYCVQGPKDIFTNKDQVGYMSDNLKLSIKMAKILGDKEKCISLAKNFSWKNCTKQFIDSLVQIDWNIND